MRYWGASPILPSTLSGLTPKPLSKGRDMLQGTINYRKGAMGAKKVVISARKGTNGVKNVVIKSLQSFGEVAE